MTTLSVTRSGGCLCGRRAATGRQAARGIVGAAAAWSRIACQIAIQIGWNGPLALLSFPMNETLASWRQAGKVSLWRYRKAPRMYADWHFSADSSACESLLALIALLTEEQGAVHRTLTLIDPQTVGADRIFGKHDLRIESPAKLRLGNAVSSNGTSVASFADDAFLLMLDFKDLAGLAEAVRDLAAEKADFAIRFGQNNRSPGTRISFWWWPKSLSA